MRLEHHLVGGYVRYTHVYKSTYYYYYYYYYSKLKLGAQNPENNARPDMQLKIKYCEHVSLVCILPPWHKQAGL